MPTDGLYPSGFRFHYQTSESIHTQTRALTQVTSAGAGDAGTVQNWAEVEVATDVMVEAYIDAWLAYQPDTTESLSYQIFQVPVIGGVEQVVFEKAYNEPGLQAALTGRKAAVQHTLTFKTTEFGQMRVISLDRQSGNTFGIVPVPASPEATFVAYVTGTSHALAGQDNGRPYTLKSLSITLNDRLMRSYGHSLP